MTAAHLDGLLVTSLPNIRYLTGFSGTSALLLVTLPEGTLMYTGDFKVRSCLSVQCAAAVAADVLVMESTLGRPVFGFRAR